MGDLFGIFSRNGCILDVAERVMGKHVVDHWLDFAGDIFQPDEHVATTSTNEVPILPRALRKALRMAALALRTAAVV